MFAIVVTWEEPEPGVQVYGPFPSEDIATAMRENVEVDFRIGYASPGADQGTLPPDVVFEVQPLVEVTL